MSYITLSIASQKKEKNRRSERPRRLRVATKQWLLQKQKKTIVETSIKKGQWAKKIIPRVARRHEP